MTFSPDIYVLWVKQYPQFIQWLLRRGDILFLPKESEDVENYDLTTKAYILMKRLGQDYSRILNMPTEERDKIFKMEMDLIREEKKQAEKNGN